MLQIYRTKTEVVIVTGPETNSPLHTVVLTSDLVLFLTANQILWIKIQNLLTLFLAASIIVI